MIKHTGFAIIFKDGSITKVEYKRSYSISNILKHVTRYIRRNNIELDEIEKIDLARYQQLHRG